jgi:hypothetical protein
MPSIQSHSTPQLRSQKTITLGATPANVAGASSTPISFPNGVDTLHFSSTPPREASVIEPTAPTEEANKPTVLVVAPPTPMVANSPVLASNPVVDFPTVVAVPTATANKPPLGGLIGAALGGIALAGTIGLGFLFHGKNKEIDTLDKALTFTKSELTNLRATVADDRVFSDTVKTLVGNAQHAITALETRFQPLETRYKLKNAMHELPAAHEKSGWVAGYFEDVYPDAETGFHGEPLRPIHIMRKKLLNEEANGNLTFSIKEKPVVLKDARTFSEEVVKRLYDALIEKNKHLFISFERPLTKEEQKIHDTKKHSIHWSDFCATVHEFRKALAPITKNNEGAWASFDTAATLPSDAKAHETIAHSIKKARIQDDTDALEQSITEAYGVLLENFGKTTDATLPKTEPTTTV